MFREDNHCLKGKGGILHHSFQSLVTAQGITTSFYQWKKNSRTHFILLSKYCRKRILRCTCTPVYHRFFFRNYTGYLQTISSLWYRVKTPQKQAKPHCPHFKNTDTEVFRILSIDQIHASQGQDRTYQR